MKTINIILAMIIAILLTLLFITPREPATYINQKNDTIIIKDTLTEYYPELVEVIKWKDSIVYLTDTQYIVLPFTKKRYTTENYDLTISGFEPQLDEITVFPEKKYIYYTTVLNEEKKKFQINHGINLSGGYGLINKKLDIYVGYGIQISF